MTADAAGPVEAVLTAHNPNGYFTAKDGHRECYCGHIMLGAETWTAHVASALAPLFAEHGAAERRAGAVEALNEAADEAETMIYPASPDPEHWANWLRARAAALGDRAETAEVELDAFGIGVALGDRADEAVEHG